MKTLTEFIAKKHQKKQYLYVITVLNSKLRGEKDKTYFKVVNYTESYTGQTVTAKKLHDDVADIVNQETTDYTILENLFKYADKLYADIKKETNMLVGLMPVLEKYMREKFKVAFEVLDDTVGKNLDIISVIQETKFDENKAYYHFILKRKH